MDLFKKTILLTSSDVKCGGMGVLTLIKSGNGVFGNFKVYNMRSSSNLVLGILINGKTIKEKVFINENNNFKLETDFDRDSQISCVLVDKQQDKVVPLVWFCGTKEISKIEIMNIVCKDEFLSNRRKLCGIDKLDEDKFGENVCDFFSNLNQKDQKVGFVDDNKLIKNNNNFDNAINNVDKNYNKVQKHDLDNTDYNDDEGKNLKVKEEFFEYTDEEIEEEIDKNLEKPFYDLIKSQIDDLFSKYPSEKFLENLIENSKWVKIDFENNGKYYVLGLIYQNLNVKYVCYGVPGRYDTLPPKEIEDYNQWIPLEYSDVGGDGYWVMYQDALTGESVNLNVV